MPYDCSWMKKCDPIFWTNCLKHKSFWPGLHDIDNYDNFRNHRNLPAIDVENEGAQFVLKEAAFITSLPAIYPDITHLMYHCESWLFSSAIDGTWTGKPLHQLKTLWKNFQNKDSAS